MRAVPDRWFRPRWGSSTNPELLLDCFHYCSIWEKFTELPGERNCVPSWSGGVEQGSKHSRTARPQTARWSRDPNIPVQLGLRRRGGKKRVPHSVVQHGHPASEAALTLKTEKLVDFLQTFWPSPGPLAFMHLIKDPGGHDLVSHLSKTLPVNLPPLACSQKTQGCSG